MVRRIGIVLATGTAIALALPGLASADSPKSSRGSVKAGSSAELYYEEGAPRPPKFVKRGGYSYGVAEITGTPWLNAEKLWRHDAPLQSSFGPFDSGFFFDSAISPRGGNAPYLN
jgi:hypothetical protein